MNENTDFEADLNNEEEPLFEHYRIVADKGQSLLRIDKFLTDRLPNVTRNKVQQAIEVGYVTVRGKTVKSNYKIKPLDEIVVMLPEPPRNDEVLPEAIPLDIRYEDDDLLVVYKPAGMVVHPAYNNWNGTLVNALLHHCNQLPTSRNGTIRPGLVHRIDKDTSGLLVIAKTELAMMHLAKQFYEHTIERTYYALVWGVPKSEKGTIVAHLDRSPKDRRIIEAFADTSKGKHAITHYKVLQELLHVALVQCNLETGRTHQIRAHMKFLGHPLFADATYGGMEIRKGQPSSKYKAFVENCFTLMPRQALHAKSLGFVHPTTKQWLQFDSELPNDFQSVLNKWEQYANTVNAQ
jgi:23S rRNA pseudouridine1911/1915/1917 synthase